MSIEVKVGQVWKDKDKRRNTVIEIIEVTTGYDEPLTAQGLVVGTEKVNTYAIDRLVKRWELVQEKPDFNKEQTIKLMEPSPEDEPIFEWDGKGSIRTLSDHAHIHVKGECVKNRDNIPCDAPKAKRAVWKGEPVKAEPIVHQTREEYLEAAVQAIITDIFTPAEVEVPPVRVSVGWPGGRGPKKNVIGQCFDKRVSKDGKAQIFVTPAIDDAYVTIETLTHELIHAIVEGHEDENGEVKHHGHRGEFVRIARAIGFEKPWKETPASEELREQLQAIADRLGEYPHAAITMEDRPAVQKTYYLKYVSPENDDYFVRVTAKKIEEYGAPLDPWGNEMEEETK